MNKQQELAALYRDQIFSEKSALRRQQLVTWVYENLYLKYYPQPKKAPSYPEMEEEVLRFLDEVIAEEVSLPPDANMPGGLAELEEQLRKTEAILEPQERATFKQGRQAMRKSQLEAWSEQNAQEEIERATRDSQQELTKALQESGLAQEEAEKQAYEILESLKENALQDKVFGDPQELRQAVEQQVKTPLTEKQAAQLVGAIEATPLGKRLHQQSEASRMLDFPKRSGVARGYPPVREPHKTEVKGVPQTPRAQEKALYYLALSTRPKGFVQRFLGGFLGREKTRELNMQALQKALEVFRQENPTSIYVRMLEAKLTELAPEDVQLLGARFLTREQLAFESVRNSLRQKDTRLLGLTVNPNDDSVKTSRLSVKRFLGERGVRVHGQIKRLTLLSNLRSRLGVWLHSFLTQPKWQLGRLLIGGGIGVGALFSGLPGLPKALLAAGGLSLPSIDLLKGGHAAAALRDGIMRLKWAGRFLAPTVPYVAIGVIIVGIPAGVLLWHTYNTRVKRAALLQAAIGGGISIPVDQLPENFTPPTSLDTEIKDFRWPVELAPHCTSPFGRSPQRSDYHLGTDIKTNDGTNAGQTEVYPIADGVVLYSGNDERGWGLYMVVQHAVNLFTLYAHLEDFRVSANQEVTRDTVIAISDNSGAGSDGPHLHLEVTNAGGSLSNFDNPSTVLPVCEKYLANFCSQSSTPCIGGLR